MTGLPRTASGLACLDLTLERFPGCLALRDWADALAGLHALAHGLRASGGFSASRDYLETALSAYHRALDVEPGRVIPDVRS